MSQIIQKSLFQNFPGILYVAKSDWTAEILNSCEQLIGYTMDEINSKDRGWLSLVHPEDKAQVFRDGHALTEKTQSLVQTYRIIIKNGDIRWVEDHKASVFNAQGELEGISGCVYDITLRKKAEQALIDSEQQYHFLIENLHSALVVHAPDTSIMLHNTKASELLGLTNDQIQGKVVTDPVWKFVREDGSRMPVNEYPVNRVMESRKPLKDHVLGIHRSHTAGLVWVLVNAFPIFNPQKEIEQVVVTFIDITERVQEQRQLWSIEERFRTIITSLPDRAIVYDAQGRYLELLSKVDDRLADNPNSLLGQLVTDVLPKETAEQIVSAIQATIKLDETQDLIYSLNIDGQDRWFEGRSSVIYDLQDESPQVLWIGRDITERRQAEIERDKLSRAVQQSPASVVVTNVDGDIEYVNPKFTELTGYTLEESIGQNPRILKSGVQSPEQYKALWDTILSGQVWHGELINKKKNGDQYWEYTSISPIVNDQDEVTHFVAVKEDITERKQLESKLRASEQFARSTIDSLSSHIAIIDEKGSILAVNTAWNRFAAENDGEIDNLGVGINYFDVLRATPSSSGDAFFARGILEGCHQVLRGETETFSLEYPCHAPHEQRWFMARITRFQAEESFRLVIAHENITERKMAENNLKFSEERFRVLSEITSDYAYSISVKQDGTSHIDWITDAFTDITGYDRHETDAGGRWQLLIHPDHKDVVKQRVEKLYMGESGISEFQIITKDGQTRWIREYTKPIWDEEQKRVTRIYGAAQDITERNQADEKVQKQAKILQSVSDVIISVDRSFNILSWNKAAEDLYGWQEHEVLVKPMAEIVPTSYLETSREDVLRDFAQHHRWSGDVIQTRRDGTELYIQAEVSAILDPFKNVIGAVAINRDVTEQKRQQQLIEKQNQELKILNRLISLSSASLDTDLVLQIANAELTQTFAATQVSSAILDDNAAAYMIIAESNRPANESQMNSVMMFVDHPALEYIEKYSIPLVIDETNRDDYSTIDSADWVQCSLIIPLKISGVVYGIFNLQFDKLRTFNDDELSFAASMMQIISQAYDKCLLHGELENHNLRLTETVQKRTNDLERINDRLSTILNTTTDAIILMDQNYRIENTNRSFDDLFGYQYDELFNQSLQVLVEAEHQESLFKVFETTRKTKTPQRLEIPMLCKNGHIFDSDLSMALVAENDGHYVCSIRDITHLKDVERTKDRFVSMVSHELRTPVSSLVLSAETLRRHYDRLTEEQKQKKLDRISQQSRNLTDLVTAILDISRFDARRKKRGRSLIDMAEPLKDVFTELVNPEKDNPHHITIQTFNQNTSTVGDHADMARIWRNLLSNAIKYTDVGGEINVMLYGGCKEVSCSCQWPNLTAFSDAIPTDIFSGTYLIGIVQDTGHGIRQEDLSSLFTRFFRGWASSTNIAGTGLGLSLVRDILQLYGGDIAVTSELGVGSTFCFWLPIDQQKGS